MLQLSTEKRPSEDDGIALIVHALERGVRLFDTADVYGSSEDDLHYGEQLLRKAFPAGCFCRKPMPGMGIDLVVRHGLSMEHLVMVGDMDSDLSSRPTSGSPIITPMTFLLSR